MINYANLKNHFNTKTLIKSIYWLIVITFLTLAFLLALSNQNLPIGFKVFNVSTGSMEPAVKQGSLIIVSPTSVYSKGDVITYSFAPDSVPITHRIHSIQKSSTGKALFITKGDNNNVADPAPISPSLVLGKVGLTIPYLGYLISFTKTQVGFSLLVVIPLTLIFYNELLHFKKELLVQIKKRQKTVLPLLLVAVFSTISFSPMVRANGYLWDFESFNNNVLEAGTLEVALELMSDENDFLNLTPGETLNLEFDVNNAGSLAIDTAIEIYDVKGEFCEVLDMRSAGNEGPDFDFTKLEDLEGDGELSVDNDLEAGEKYNLDLDLKVMDIIPVALSNEECAFKVKVHAWEPSNSKNVGFYDSAEYTVEVTSTFLGNDSDEAKYHYQPLGQVTGSNFDLDSYSYRFTKLDTFNSGSGEGLLLNCYNESTYTTQCPGGYSIINADNLSIKDISTGEYYCGSDTTSCNTAVTTYSNLDETHVYEVKYFGNFNFDLQADKYYMAIIGNPVESFSVLGTEFSLSSRTAKKSGSNNSVYSSIDYDDSISSIDICLNDSLCGPFPMSIAGNDGDN